ncbi:MAG: hypothetical protein P9L98_00975 [Candidatus Kaelpia imicola]|nr:hypothetical protein [Candidatus Kaelpia imicola]
MIVKMKQVTLLVSNRERERALERLRSLGVMHIKGRKSLSSGEISFLEDKISIFERAIELISDFNTESDKDCPGSKIPAFIEEINFLGRDRDDLQNRLAAVRRDLYWYGDWGIFSLDSLSKIREHGINLELYIVGKKEFKEIIVKQNAYLIKKDKSRFYVALVANNKNPLSAAPQQIPSREYSMLERERSDTEKQIQEIDKRAIYLSSFKNCFNRYKSTLGKELEFAQVNSEMNTCEGFSFLEGFIPVDTAERLNTLSEEEGWGLLLKDPGNPDEVPTLIRNPSWLRIIDPVFKLMDTIPGYEEYDISFWFLIFFGMFFAMIIGDAGYGLIFLITAFLIQIKNKNISKQITRLIYYLSSATVIWGAITGNWFGIERFSQLPFFNIFIIPGLNNFVDANQNNFIYLCFILGFSHLAIAHLVAALRFVNSIKFFSHLGWIAIGWSMFLLTRGVVLNLQIPQTMTFFVILGALMVMIFSKPETSILKRITSSLLDLPFGIINFFADILSYLRLFAVGYATVMIAVTFNNMARDIGFNSVPAIISSVVIILLGHSLNIILGLMSVLVHGVRLNVLEFPTHLSLEWKGNSYKPFKE